ncbi:MAG: UDP-glucose/GDP-mannose dehydrogenase family protein [Candidatus Omnitrophica bacterium]|nr:UDP-glucose/GDP-mannose dehydrogenase family protein [Candidatus Omnitrophota bacterium]
MDIGVIGAGYVGLVTAACFAKLGHKVICVDIDTAKINALKKGKIPIYEPGLDQLVRSGLRAKNIYFTANIKSAIAKSTVIFIAVGTPPKDNGEADLTYIENVARKIATEMPSYRLIVEKSTVPVQTGKRIEETIKAYNKKKIKFDVASNPEFLREGQAISDFLSPDRIVIGVNSKKARDILSSIYASFKAPIIVTDIESAELIKHASNSFLAMKISYINSIANICERCGADIVKVSKGIGLDRRIGKDFLNSGVGFGGFCFPKDLEAFIRISEKLGYDFDLLRSVKRVNDYQKILFIKKIEESLWVLNGKTIAVLGIAFKPNTDDIRYAPAIDIIKMLQNEGVKIKAFDPQAMKNAKTVLKDVKFCKDAYSAVRDSDCLCIITDWDEFKSLDLKRVKRLMKQPIIVDGRNIYEPKDVEKFGLKYKGIGRYYDRRHQD